MVRDQQGAVERGRLPGNQLGTQVGEIADVFVLPHQKRVELSLFALALRVGNPLPTQSTDVNSRFVSDLKRSPRKTIHPILRFNSLAFIGRHCRTLQQEIPIKSESS